MHLSRSKVHVSIQHMHTYLGRPRKGRRGQQRQTHPELHPSFPPVVWVALNKCGEMACVGTGTMLAGCCIAVLAYRLVRSIQGGTHACTCGRPDWERPAAVVPINRPIYRKLQTFRRSIDQAIDRNRTPVPLTACPSTGRARPCPTPPNHRTPRRGSLESEVSLHQRSINVDTPDGQFSMSRKPSEWCPGHAPHASGIAVGSVDRFNLMHWVGCWCAGGIRVGSISVCRVHRGKQSVAVTERVASQGQNFGTINPYTDHPTLHTQTERTGQRCGQHQQEAAGCCGGSCC